jgi:hypothetical protein
MMLKALHALIPLRFQGGVAAKRTGWLRSNREAHLIPLNFLTTPAAAQPPLLGKEGNVAQRQKRSFLFLAFFLFSSVTLLAADQILCSLGPGTSSYNAYSDERPTPDAMELAGKVNGGLGSVCRPNCPTMSMFRNKSAPNLMLLVASGQAKIVYKPEFFTTVYEMYGDGGILALIAHEVGHAMDANGAAKWMKPAWSPELRADAWAGCAFAKVNLPTRDLRAGLNALQKFPSPAHPDWTMRAPVLRTGYMECGGDVSKLDK